MRCNLERGEDNKLNSNKSLLFVGYFFCGFHVSAYYHKFNCQQIYTNQVVLMGVVFKGNSQLNVLESIFLEEITKLYIHEHIYIIDAATFLHITYALKYQL